MKMNVDGCHILRNATLQPLSIHSVRIYGDAMGPKYPLMSAVNGKGMPKNLLAISKLLSSVEIGRPPNLIPKMVVQSRGRIVYSPQLKWKVPILA